MLGRRARKTPSKAGSICPTQRPCLIPLASGHVLDRLRSPSWCPRKAPELLNPWESLSGKFTSTKLCIPLPILPMFGAGKDLSHSIGHHFSFICSLSENHKEMVKKCYTRFCPKDLYSLGCFEDLKPPL